MPQRETLERVRKDAREGKSPSTQAGEFVPRRDHVREGKHGARSPQQAIAIGLSKARRAGVKLGPPKGSASVRKKAAQDLKKGKRRKHKTRIRSRILGRELDFAATLEFLPGVTLLGRRDCCRPGCNLETLQVGNGFLMLEPELVPNAGGPDVVPNPMPEPDPQPPAPDPDPEPSPAPPVPDPMPA